MYVGEKNNQETYTVLSSAIVIKSVEITKT